MKKSFKILFSLALIIALAAALAVSAYAEAAAVTAAPAAAQGLVYNNCEYELLASPGSADSHMEYCIDSSATAPASGWSAAMPKAIDAGTYRVWFRAADNGEGASEADYLDVTIKQRTLKLLGGSAADKYYDGGDTATVTFPSGPVLEGAAAGESAELSNYSGASFSNVAAGSGISVYLNSYMIDITGGRANPSNYDLDQSALRASILPVPLTITPDAGQCREFGESDPAFTFTISSEYLNETLNTAEIVLSRELGDNAGSYAFTDAYLGMYEGNYTASIPADAPKFEIYPATFSLTASSIGSFVEPVGDGSSGELIITGIYMIEANYDLAAFTVSGTTSADKVGKYTAIIESTDPNAVGSVEFEWEFLPNMGLADALNSNALNSGNVLLDDIYELRLFVKMADTMGSDSGLSTDTATAISSARDKAKDLLDILDAVYDAFMTDNVKKLADDNISDATVEPSNRDLLLKVRKDLAAFLLDPAYEAYIGEELEDTVMALLAYIDSLVDIIEDAEDAAKPFAEAMQDIAEDKESTKAERRDELDELLEELEDELEKLDSNVARIVKALLAKQIEELEQALGAYNFISGSGQLYIKKSGDISFTVNGPAKLFKQIVIGKSILNPTDYVVKEVKKGTLITIKGSVIDELDDGKHYINASYTDGGIAYGLFFAYEKDAAPATGDDSNVGLWACVMLMSLAAMAAGAVVIKKRSEG